MPLNISEERDIVKIIREAEQYGFLCKYTQEVVNIEYAGNFTRSNSLDRKDGERLR